jgi:hypothetical protein
MKDVAWRREQAAGDPIAALAPRAIWRIRRAGGAPLDGMHVWAWCWLMERTEGKPLPCRIEFKAADLAAYYERSSHASALDWIKALKSAGLVGDVETERGMFGCSRARPVCNGTWDERAGNGAGDKWKPRARRQSHLARIRRTGCEYDGND